MKQKQVPNSFEQFSTLMQDNSRAVEIITYGIAFVGLSTALYKIRPFARFTSPNQVPKHFFTNKILLKGTVKSIDLGKSVCLLVDHKPIVSLPRLGATKYLPVKISGVNINGNGLSWLQTVVTGKKITFLPISAEKNFLTCIVMVAEKDKKPLSVGKELIKIGFGTVEDGLQPTSAISNDVKVYEKSLKLAQKLAKRKRNGIWQEKYPPTLMWKFKNILDNKLKSKLPAFLLKYFNI